MKLTAALICRDEAARYQPHLIEWALAWADEIRVLDDCSTDGTGDAIDRLDPRVYVKRVMGTSVWDLWGEGVARQQLLDWALEGKPTHVLAIDADEFIPDGRQLRQTVRRNPDADVFTLRMVEVWERDRVPWRIRVDGGWAPRDVPICWRVPPDPAADGWSIRPARLASGREPEMAAMLAAMGDCVPTGADICHLGWSNPEERRPRSDRYMRIDGGRFHADAHLRSIMEPPTLEAYPGYPAVLRPISRPVARFG